MSTLPPYKSEWLTIPKIRSGQACRTRKDGTFFGICALYHIVTHIHDDFDLSIAIFHDIYQCVTYNVFFLMTYDKSRIFLNANSFYDFS